MNGDENKMNKKLPEWPCKKCKINKYCHYWSQCDDCDKKKLYEREMEILDFINRGIEVFQYKEFKKHNEELAETQLAIYKNLRMEMFGY